MFLSLPKADIHHHLCGAFDIDLLYDISERLSIPLKLPREEYRGLQKNFSCLADLLTMIGLGMEALVSPAVLHDLVYHSFSRYTEQNVVYVESAVDIRIFQNSNFSVTQAVNALSEAASRLLSVNGLKVNFLLEFKRSVDIDRQMSILNSMYTYSNCFRGVGVASDEFQNPSRNLKPLYDQARIYGFCGTDGKNATAHTGEEAPSCYVKETLDYLGVSRIDHGVRAFEDPLLIDRIVNEKIGLAMAPISNRMLKVLDRFCAGKWIFGDVYNRGCRISINSDDPGCNGVTLNDNFNEFYSLYEGTDKDEAILNVLKNGFRTSFLDESEKNEWVQKIDKQVFESS